MHSLFVKAAALTALSLLVVPAFSQGMEALQANPDILVPDTSVPKSGDRGVRAHTNFLISVRRPGVTDGSISVDGSGPGTFGGLGPGGGMTPTQIRSFYNMPSTGGAGTIAIVIAYHYPTALNDFNVFSNQFGLPKETSTEVTRATNTAFQIVYASGTKPGRNSGWNQEAALDIEWSHSLAPNAKIVLVEARSNSYTDLFAAVDKAVSLPGVKQVSMSWGGGEFSGETYYDSHFANKNVVFFASSGDSGGVVSYPSVSQYVVSVGGTKVTTTSTGVFSGETGWSGSGGGTSLYVAKPAYQNNIPQTPSTKRGVPDISADADPYTGVSVYWNGYWLVFGGTSVSCPCMAGMANVSGSHYTTTAAQLTAIYAANGSANYRDILTGTAGSFSCTAGWDFVTGVGSPQGTSAL